MKILALDLSTKSTGYAIKDNDKLLDYGCITQPSSKNFIDRIYIIVDKILEIIRDNEIKDVVCEEVRFADADSGDQKNLHTFKTLMYLQSHLVCKAHREGMDINFTFMQPSEHRARVGIPTGRGVKRDVCKAMAIKYVKDHYDMFVNDDIADAITLADAAVSGNTIVSKPKQTYRSSESRPSAF